MKKLIFFLAAILFLGCSKNVYNVSQNQQIPKNLSVIPFANFTQTQLAGYKVAAITEGVLKSKGYNVTSSLWNYPEEDYTLNDIKNLIQNNPSRFIVTGYVNEYKYKAGIDGEPAISITLKIYDKELHKDIYKATISAVGNSYDSLGVLTQENLEEVIASAPSSKK